jgi:hypothetical protein
MPDILTSVIDRLVACCADISPDLTATRYEVESSLIKNESLPMAFFIVNGTDPVNYGQAGGGYFTINRSITMVIICTPFTQNRFSSDGEKHLFNEVSPWISLCQWYFVANPYLRLSTEDKPFYMSGSGWSVSLNKEIGISDSGIAYTKQHAGVEITLDISLKVTHNFRRF